MRSRKGASSWRLLLATAFAAMLVIKVACSSEASVGNRQSADPDELYQSIFQNEFPTSCKELSQTLPDNSLPNPDILPPSNLNLLKDGDLTNLNNQNNSNNAGNAYAPNQYHDIPSTFQTDTSGKPVYPSVGQQDNQQGFPSQTQPTYPPQYPAHDQSSPQQPFNPPYYPYVQDSLQQVPKYPYPGQHPANGAQASDQFNQPSLNNANMPHSQAYPSQSYPYGSQQYPNQQYPNQQYPNANQQYPNQQYLNQQYPYANQQQPLANQFPSNTVPTGDDKQPHDSAYQPKSLDQIISELLNEIRKRNNPYLKAWADEDVKRFGNRKDVLIQHLKNLLNADDINKYYSMPPYQSAPRSVLNDMDYSNVPQKNLNEQNRTVPPNSPSMTPKFPDEFMKKDEDSESKQAQIRKIAAEKRSLPPTDQSRQLYNNEPRSMPFANNAARSFSLDQQLQQKQQRAETPKFDQMIPRSRLNESDCPNGLTMFRHPSRDGLTFLTAPEAEGYGYEYFFSKPKNGGPSYVTEAYVGPFFQKQRNGSGILFRWNYKTNQMENVRVENDRGREVGIRPRPSLGFAASPDPCRFLYGLMNHEIVKRTPSTFSPPFPLVGGLLGKPMMTGY